MFRFLLCCDVAAARKNTVFVGRMCDVRVSATYSRLLPIECHFMQQQLLKYNFVMEPLPVALSIVGEIFFSRGEPATRQRFR